MPGITSKLAIVKGATWGTLPSLTTGHRAPFTAETLSRSFSTIDDNSLLGKSTRAIGANGSANIGGQLAWLRDYRQRQHQIVAAVFAGAAGVPTTIETGVYKHVLPWQPNPAGLFIAAGVDLGGADVHGFPSLKPVRRTIRIAGGRPHEESYEFLGGGAVDKSIASSGWTYLTDPNGNGARRILASQTVIRANAHAGAALDSTNVIKPSSIEINMARGLAQDFPVGQSYGEEPVPGDWSSVTVTLQFFNMTAALLALFLDNRDADTPLKMDVIATHGTLLGATKYRESSFYFPKLRVIDCPTSVPGPGVIPMPVTMEAHFSDAVPTGFPSGYDEEVTEEIQNEVSTDLLA